MQNAFVNIHKAFKRSEKHVSQGAFTKAAGDKQVTMRAPESENKTQNLRDDHRGREGRPRRSSRNHQKRRGSVEIVTWLKNENGKIVRR